MNTSYRRLIAWSALASVVLIALSAGIAAASPEVPVGGDCGVPLLAASYEWDAPCVPFDACTGTTTLWTAMPCSENDRIAQCVEIAETHQVITSLCRDLVPLFDVCLPDGSRRWSVDRCDYQPAAEIGDPQVIDKALPKTGSTTSTLAKIAGILVAVGLLCLVVRGISRDIDSDGAL